MLLSLSRTFSTVGAAGCAIACLSSAAVGILFYYPLIFGAYSARDAASGLKL